MARRLDQDGRFTPVPTRWLALSGSRRWPAEVLSASSTRVSSRDLSAELDAESIRAAQQMALGATGRRECRQYVSQVPTESVGPSVVLPEVGLHGVLEAIAYRIRILQGGAERLLKSR